MLKYLIFTLVGGLGHSLSRVWGMEGLGICAQVLVIRDTGLNSGMDIRENGS
jgi:hypothetical protein